MTTSRSTTGSTPPPSPAPPSTEALAQLVNAASALQAVQAAAATEALRIPDKRLDDASPGGGSDAYTLMQSGVDDQGEPIYIKVDANGKEVTDSGEAKADDAAKPD